MKVCLVYELNNREYYNMVLLERELLRRGHSVKMCHKSESINLISQYDVTIIPNSYVTSDVDFYRYVFNIKNNHIIVFPCEQVVNHTLPDFFDRSDSNEVKKLPHLCWGTDYYEWIKELGFRNSASRITGALQLDLCRPEFRTMYMNKAEIAKKFNLPNNPKWVLFISDFVLMNEARFEHSLNAGVCDRETYTKKRSFEEKTNKAILSWFDKLLSASSEYIIIYRKHPVEILTDEIVQFAKKHAKQFYLISDLSIKEWIFNCDVITTWNSTALIECFAGGVNVGLLRPFQFSDEPAMTEYSFYKYYNAVTTYDEFEQCIKKGPVEYNHKTIDEINILYSIEKKPSFVRVAEAIEDIYKSTYSNRSKKPIKWFEIKRFLYLCKKHIFLKLLLKNVYKQFYKLVGKRIKGTEKKRIAFNEWMLSVDNSRIKNSLSKSIDNIINQMRY